MQEHPERIEACHCQIPQLRNCPTDVRDQPYNKVPSLDYEPYRPRHTDCFRESRFNTSNAKQNHKEKQEETLLASQD